jgi:hypothetical protein
MKGSRRCCGVFHLWIVDEATPFVAREYRHVHELPSREPCQSECMTLFATFAKRCMMNTGHIEPVR